MRIPGFTATSALGELAGTRSPVAAKSFCSSLCSALVDECWANCHASDLACGFKCDPPYNLCKGVCDSIAAVVNSVAAI